MTPETIPYLLGLNATMLAAIVGVLWRLSIDMGAMKVEVRELRRTVHGEDR